MPPKKRLKSRLVEKEDEQAGGETGNLDQRLTYPKKKEGVSLSVLCQEVLTE